MFTDCLTDERYEMGRVGDCYCNGWMLPFELYGFRVRGWWWNSKNVGSYLGGEYVFVCEDYSYSFCNILNLSQMPLKFACKVPSSSMALLSWLCYSCLILPPSLEKKGVFFFDMLSCYHSSDDSYRLSSYKSSPPEMNWFKWDLILPCDGLYYCYFTI